MNNSGYIRVLDAFNPYLRLIKSYNSNNFRQPNWHCISSNAFYAFVATTTLISLPIFQVLGIWYMFENEASLINMAITLPILITITQIEITFGALIIKNGVIDEIINKLQQLIDHRESWYWQSRTFLKNSKEPNTYSFLSNFNRLCSFTAIASHL